MQSSGREARCSSLVLQTTALSALADRTRCRPPGSQCDLAIPLLESCPQRPERTHRGEILGRLGNVDQMMWHASLLGGRNLGGCDVDSAIDLNGIEIDDLTVKGERELDGEFAFARRGRPDD